MVTTVSPSDTPLRISTWSLRVRADLHEARLEVTAVLRDEQVVHLARVDDRLGGDHEAGGGRQVQVDGAVHAGAQARPVSVDAVPELEAHAQRSVARIEHRVDELHLPAWLSPGNDDSSRRAGWPTWMREMSCS